MSHNMENDGKNVTITDLVATDDENESQYFRSTSTDECIEKRVLQGPAKVLIKQRLCEKDMLVHGSQLGPQYADEYRRIKRPLLSNAFGKSSSLLEKGNLILVTSSLPGEGKTHTAINLALSIAHERDHTVLLVDCDVARHGASQVLGISDRPGLVEILEDDDIAVSDALLHTDIPELYLIPSGRQHDFVTELLASQKMSDLVEEIGRRYDDRVIIFDGPPLLPTPQTQVLTELVGQVVFVVEAGQTPQSLVQEALNMISEEQAIGLVMNKIEGVASRSGYYYGYYGEK